MLVRVDADDEVRMRFLLGHRQLLRYSRDAAGLKGLRATGLAQVISLQWE